MRPSGWALIQSDLCPYQSRKVWEFPGSLVVRILGFHCLGPGSTPGWGTEIPQATWCSQKERKVGHTPGMHACTEERPHEETVRRQPSAGEGEGPQKKPGLPAP